MRDDLVAFVDLAPTVLSIAGVEIPSVLQGRPFLGAAQPEQPREYVYGARDRMDERVDMIRSVRASPKLFGHRGARPVDVGALEDLIARLSCLADGLPDVAYVDLNPVVVGEHGAAVLSATVHLRTLARHDDRRELGALT